MSPVFGANEAKNEHFHQQELREITFLFMKNAVEIWGETFM